MLSISDGSQVGEGTLHTATAGDPDAGELFVLKLEKIRPGLR
jgi:hypothetical protein